jgi:hypothetical protein
MNLNMPCELQLREKKKKTRDDKFEIIIREAVDEIFSSLGQSAKQAIYFQLKHTFKIKKQDIPFKIEDFANALEQIFGAGAKFIELRIIETLHEKIPNFMYSPKIEDLVFIEYVASLRCFFTATDCEFSKLLPLQRKRIATQLLQNKPHFLFP